jgi:hypothetical protein
MMKSSRGYVRQELLTEAQRLEAVHRAVEKIIDYHQEQIPETEKSMEQYVCQNEVPIKECLKVHILQLLGHRHMQKITSIVLSICCYRDKCNCFGRRLCIEVCLSIA